MSGDTNIIAVEVYVTEGNLSLPKPDDRGVITVYDTDGGTKGLEGPHVFASYLVTLQDKQKEVQIAVSQKDGHVELEGIGRFMEEAGERDEGTLEIMGKVHGFRYIPKEDLKAE